jgi:hypothetical protein
LQALHGGRHMRIHCRFRVHGPCIWVVHQRERPCIICLRARLVPALSTRSAVPRRSPCVVTPRVVPALRDSLHPPRMLVSGEPALRRMGCRKGDYALRTIIPVRPPFPSPAQAPSSPYACRQAAPPTLLICSSGSWMCESCGDGSYAVGDGSCALCPVSPGIWETYRGLLGLIIAVAVIAAVVYGVLVGLVRLAGGGRVREGLVNLAVFVVWCVNGAG